jgi:hypothetical protein
MRRAVRNSAVPIFFFQAKNDYDLSPSRVLAAAAKDAGRPYELKIYSAYGNSADDGHTLGYFGAAVWTDDVFSFLDRHCMSR